MIGDSARKVVVMGLWRGFVQIQEIALVCLRKRKDAKYGITIVNHCQVLIILNEIYLCIQSDFDFTKVNQKLK